MSKHQVHKAIFKISRDIELPQYEDGGIEVELRAHDEKLGELRISGAHVYFRPRHAHHEKCWDFTKFAELLTKAESQH